MDELGVPVVLVEAIQNLYWETVAHIQGHTDMACTFCMNKGVKQGCCASPQLFCLFFDRVASYMDTHLVPAPGSQLFSLAL